MDPTSRTSSFPDYPVRPRDTAAPKIVANVPPPRSESHGAQVTDNGHMREYLQAKPDQVKNRENDEQVTRQRTQDKAQGTMFDVRA